MLNDRTYAPVLLAACGIILIGLRAHFAIMRPPRLLEATRAIGAASGQITALAPGLSSWLRHIFWVMGGYMSGTGVLTIYVGLVSVPGRARGAAGVATLTGLLSIGWMSVVNFIIDSDFKWLLLGFVLLWGSPPGAAGRRRAQPRWGLHPNEQEQEVRAIREARHGGSTMLDISPPENKHESHMQEGRATLQQDGPTPEAARNPDAMQSYAEAAETGVDHSAMAGMDHSSNAVPGMDYSKMAGMKHGGMSHDMSDPAMAQAMEADMRTRFFVALLLTIPVILYSPLGQGLL
ncbi:MAG: hypothetical protein M3014_00920, partial [Chloroflexota bacterium]|nr:hypothetical protein [Chloroflexota bacterium]